MKRSEAISLGLSHYNTGNPCKHGHIASRRVKDRVCMECDLTAKKARNVDLEAKREEYYKHRAKRLSQKRLYRQANKGKINALNAKRKQHIKQRTPIWVTAEELWLVKEAYELAEKRTNMFGFKWHVDHIIPLQGKNVSGLHVIGNLQVITAVENIRKKNKYAE
jgi:hypothetical protein